MMAISDAIPELEDLDDKSFDAFAMERLQNGDVLDPWSTIHKLREQAPVHKIVYRDLFSNVPSVHTTHLDHYAVFGYDVIFGLLSKPDIYSNKEAFQHTLGQFFGQTISAMDPPEHAKYRRIFQRAFLPQIIAQWGTEYVDPVVENLLARFRHRGEADLVQEFALHYPFQIIYRQLAISDEQAPIFHKLAVAQLLATIGLPQGTEATSKLGAFFQRLVEHRRANPGPDLVSHLARIQVDEEYLPDEVVVSFLRQLINAGGDTTYRGTTALLVGLLSNPDQLAAVAADRSLIPRAIEEALRWEGPVLATQRTTLADTELGGVQVPKGAFLSVVLGSANRDPAKFKDPDRFDIFRDASVRNLAFASGPHLCLGQHLARLEMTRALNALLDELPNLRLDPSREPPLIRGHHLRSPEHIFVRFDP